MDQKILIESIDSYERVVRNVLLASMETLLPIEFISICNEMLPIIRAKQMTKTHLAKHFVLITCRSFLSQLNLSDIATRYNRKCVSEYRYWLFMDAFATRSLIHQHLGEEANIRCCNVILY